MTSANFAILPIGRDMAHRLLLMLLLALGLIALPAFAGTTHVSEANLVLPNLNDVSLAQFLGGISGSTLLSYGLIVCIGGLVLSLIHI